MYRLNTIRMWRRWRQHNRSRDLGGLLRSMDACRWHHSTEIADAVDGLYRVTGESLLKCARMGLLDMRRTTGRGLQYRLTNRGLWYRSELH